MWEIQPYSLDTAVGLTVAVLVVLTWAVYDGQFEDLERASRLPLDEDPETARRGGPWRDPMEVDPRGGMI